MPALSPSSIAVIVVALLVVLILILVAVRAQRTRHLQRRFGPEYDRTVAAAQDRREAESQLQAREKQRQRFRSRDLDAGELSRFREQWGALQVRFVDEPSASVRDADALVNQVMTQRGYPMSEFEQRSADISVDYPNVVENYRHARRISVANNDGKASTEDLRRSLVYYRSLFDELLGSSTTDRLKETV